MSIKKIVLVLFLGALIAIVVDLFVAPVLAARLATLPLVERYGLYHPQAPIVITKRESVRVSDSNDALESVNQAKGRLVAIFSLNNGSPVISGTAASLTSDGYFVTVKSALPPAGTDYFLSMPDGSVAPIVELFLDKATDLVIIHGNVSNQSVINFAKSADLEPAQKLFLLASTLRQRAVTFDQSYVASSQSEMNSEMNIDYPGRTFAMTHPATVPGTAIVSLGGDLAGMWSVNKVVSSDVIKNFTEAFFRNNKQVIRSSYGFSYRMINPAESQLDNIPQGAIVTKLTANGSAARAGVLLNDIITKVNEDSIDDSRALEEVLQQFSSGQKLRLTLIRNNIPVIIELSPEILK